MTTAEERLQRIGQIRELPAKLEKAIAGLSDEQLDMPGGGEDWSVRQVVHHLADSHLNAFIRTKLILTEDKPILKPIDQDAWAGLLDATGLPLESSLQILRGLHARWTMLLEKLPEESWSRQGVHLQNGLMTLDDILRIYSNHGQVHLDQIGKIRAAEGERKA